MSFVNSLANEMRNKGYDKKYIDLCIVYSENLISKKLPVIFDGKHLAALLGIKYSTLSYYVYQNTKFYKKFKISKKNGGFREIDSPSLNLKKIQKWILENILETIDVSQNAFGFRKNLSISDNAINHTHRKIVYNIDIKNFFPSISREDVFYIFYKLGYTYEISYIFSKLLTNDDRLPQGAPTSPYLSNIKCEKLDKSLELFCQRINATYTRYADDITVSTNNSKSVKQDIKTIKKIILKHNFNINFKKERLQKSNQMQEVTGLIVNNGVKIKRQYKKEVEKEIYYCKKFGVTSHLKKTNQDHLSFYKEYLYGKVNFINSIEPDVADRYYRELEEINW